jgi:outer membrane receptor protein involved in Fe transport
MKINFSNHFQARADTHGDRPAIVNVERNRRTASIWDLSGVRAIKEISVLNTNFRYLEILHKKIEEIGMNKIARKTALALAITAIAGGHNMVQAQAMLEEVIVTAQKRPQSLQDVPISVSALSADKIADAGIQRFEDAAAYIPNFTLTKSSIGDTISIRGISSGTNAGFEQSVGTFVDGIYRGRSVQSRFAFLDVGMLEVLRGPQGTLFGKNTVAGALNITSAKPTDELEAELKASYNIDFEQTEYTGYVSGPLSDTLRGRIAFTAREMKKGWVENKFYNDDDPQTDEWAGRISLQWDASDTTLVSFKYEHGEWVSAVI